jgi:hypothetical protein
VKFTGFQNSLQLSRYRIYKLLPATETLPVDGDVYYNL